MGEQQKYAANSFNNVAQLQLMQMISPAAKKILDLGCGDGKTTRILQELLPKAELYGLTANEEEAEVNSDATLKIIFGDAHKLPFENNFFDVIYARHILEHCIAPFIAIGELNRVLVLGGQAIIAVPENNEWADSYPDHYSVLSRSMWEKLFIQCGFTIVESLTGSWFAWGAAAELPELRFKLEKTSDFISGEELVHVFSPKVGKQLVEPPKQLTKNQLAFVFHNLVTYESMRNVLYDLKSKGITFDIIVPVSATDANAQRMFEDTAERISMDFPEVQLSSGISNMRYKAAFLPFLPFFFSIECDYIVRYQYGIGKAAYNFDIWSMNFDYILCQSNYDYIALRNYTQAKILGNPKFLTIASHKPTEDFSILYMPTYGELSSLDERFELIRELSKKYNIKIKLHHMTLYYEPERVEMIKEIFDESNIFTHNDFLSDLFQSTNLVISDTSGAIFDSIQYGVPLVLLKKKGQLLQGSQISLEDQLVLDKRIPTIFTSDDLGKIESIRSNYQENIQAITELREQLFPVAPEQVINNYTLFIDDLLKDNVDSIALDINRKKLTYLTQLESTVETQKTMLEKLEESYALQKNELLALLEEYKGRVKDLSDQLISHIEQGMDKDSRIFKLSEQLNSLYEVQSIKDNRINELSEEVNLLRQQQVDKDNRIQELSKEINLLLSTLNALESEDKLASEKEG